MSLTVIDDKVNVIDEESENNKAKKKLGRNASSLDGLRSMKSGEMHMSKTDLPLNINVGSPRAMSRTFVVTKNKSPKRSPRKSPTNKNTLNKVKPYLKKTTISPPRYRYPVSKPLKIDSPVIKGSPRAGAMFEVAPASNQEFLASSNPNLVMYTDRSKPEMTSPPKINNLRLDKRYITLNEQSS